MNIMIDHTFMQPIYEQITEQIKYQILHDTLPVSYTHLTLPTT